MAQILGRIVDDGNRDFTENNGSGGFDLGVPGVQVTLLDRFGTVLQTTFTDSNGNYIFTGVEVGNIASRCRHKSATGHWHQRVLAVISAPTAMRTRTA